MTDLRSSERLRLRQLDRDQLSRYQLARLNQLLSVVLPSNRFYSERVKDVSLPLESLEQLSEFPLTTKLDLVGEGQSQLAENRTYPSDHYVRFHRTSGTSGKPLGVCDTSVDWHWWIETWQFVLDAAEVTSHDIAVLAFSFGPFIGFWSANDALAYRGAMVVPTGGMSTVARLRALIQLDATVLCCTPSYALHMAQVAAEENLDVSRSAIRVIILAGEPGGSISSTRQCIEQQWGARVVDHAGATEIGPWGYGDAAGRGLHIIESEFVAEFLRPGSDDPADDGDDAELVLTTLGRTGSPVIRYRTGDLVRPRHGHPGSARFVMLEGGVVGRVDDMVVVRGVNIYPTAVEQIVREFPEVGEYRAIATRKGNLDSLTVEIEAPDDTTEQIAAELYLRLGLKITVQAAEAGTLPRFKAKAQRFLDQR